MRDNLAKRALREGRPVFGTFVRYPDPTLVEVVAHPGPVDHGAGSPASAPGSSSIVNPSTAATMPFAAGASRAVSRM